MGRLHSDDSCFATVTSRFLPAALLSLALALPASTSASPPVEYSDLWWNAQESGWGVGLQRQGDVIFLTLFVYGADGNPTWLVAPDVGLLTADGAASSWSGKLYRTQGPGFAAPFDAVQATEVGTASLDFASAEGGLLRYTVDGVAVAKQITRMTWREPSAAGAYHGGFSSQVANCPDTRRNGPYDFLGALTVTQAGTQVIAQIASTRAGQTSNCTFTGQARTTGRLQRWDGTFSCRIFLGFDDRGENVEIVARSGAFVLERIAATSNGFHGTLTAADQDCAFTGHFGGTRLP
jgi:hypothetical protein